MRVIRRLTVPTGDILVVTGEKGYLECLSLGDYGKDVNIKADFLGLARTLQQVEHTELMPLTEKWVVTISTQYGCSMNCKFCDVPRVGPGANATEQDLIDQVHVALSLHPEVQETKRLNIHYARMGEPTWNLAVLTATEKLACQLANFNVHPVVSTMMPRHNGYLRGFIEEWMFTKNTLLSGNAGLQLSVNSTNESEREYMFGGLAMRLADISDLMSRYIPKGRKITLNFAVADWEIDAKRLRSLFDPAHYIVKLTPMHKTASAVDAGISTSGDYTTYYPYQEHEENLKSVGFDVLVFIASKEEDESRITCGNAILAEGQR